MGQPTPGPKPTHRSALPLALVTAVIAAVWAGWNAWAVQQGRTTPLDLDGWGWLVAQMQTNGRSLATLFSSPSLWKGPVVPFVFGLCYCIAPMAESVLVLNAAFFALSAAVLVCAFHALGANRWAATAAVLAWVLYFPHAIVFGYYYAEPFLGLLSALLLLLAAWTLKAKPRSGRLGVRGRRRAAAPRAGAVPSRRGGPRRVPVAAHGQGAVDGGRAISAWIAGPIRPLAHSQLGNGERIHPLHNGGRKDSFPGDVSGGRRSGDA